MSDYSEIKKQLIDRREHLIGKVSQISRSSRATLEYDFAEQAVQREGLEVLTALDSSLSRELEQIEHALKRMEKGEYGICEDCGEFINPKRLEAVPFASLCIKCAA